VELGLGLGAQPRAGPGSAHLPNEVLHRLQLLVSRLLSSMDGACSVLYDIFDNFFYGEGLKNE
jgi:hypothetical protein